jgi:hypothetical protein
MYRPIDVPACSPRSCRPLRPASPDQVPGGPGSASRSPPHEMFELLLPRLRRWRRMPRPPPWESPRGLLAPGRFRWCGGSVPSGNSTPRQRSSPTRPGSSRRSGPGPPPSRATAGTVRERRARGRRERPLAHPLVGEPRAARNLAVAARAPRRTMRQPMLLGPRRCSPHLSRSTSRTRARFRRRRSEPKRPQRVRHRSPGRFATAGDDSPGGSRSPEHARSPQDRPAPPDTDRHLEERSRASIETLGDI